MFFQNPGEDHEAGENVNGAIYRSFLVNSFPSMIFDGSLAMSWGNSIPNNGAYQGLAYDAFGVDRDERVLNSFNFFARGDASSSEFPVDNVVGGNQRWLVVFDGSTQTVLYNERLPDPLFQGQNLSGADITEIRAAINSAEPFTQGPPVESYEIWAEAEISDADLRAEDADADSDGLTNLFEYAYGTDPEVADSERGPRMVNADGVVTLQYQRSTTAAVEPLSLIGGASLENLTPFDSGDLETIGVAEGEIEEVTVDLSTLGERFFLRLTTSSL